MKKRDALKRKKINEEMENSPRTRDLIEQIKSQDGARGSSLMNFNGKAPKIVHKNLKNLKDYGELKFQKGIYIGQVKNIKPNGKGKMIYKDHYDLGYFVDGKKNGYCLTVRNIGIIEEGDYKNNKYHGLVAQYHPDGYVDFGLLIENQNQGIWAVKYSHDDDFKQEIYKDNILIE